jgi:pimeloyl-ACP methyl ester carboxylesterase
MQDLKMMKNADGIFSQSLFLEVNGDEQRLVIDTMDTNLPIMLFLHGYATPTSLFDHYYRQEKNSGFFKYFMIVHWDQRGAGMSYSRDTDVSTMTQEQFVADAHVVIEYLKKRFNREKIYLMAQSWGSIIGMRYLFKYPENVAGYIGEGQAADYPAWIKYKYDYALGRAKSEGNKNVQKKLEKLEIPDENTNPKEIMKFNMKVNRWANSYVLSAYHGRNLKSTFFKALKESPYYHGLFAKINVLKSMAFTQRNTLSELMITKLSEEIHSVKIPVNFFMGEYDFLLPGVREFYEQLKAPDKELVIFKSAGHSPSFDNSDLFESEMIRVWKLSE